MQRQSHLQVIKQKPNDKFSRIITTKFLCKVYYFILDCSQKDKHFTKDNQNVSIWQKYKRLFTITETIFYLLF